MSPSLRRLMKEAAELSSSPSPHFHAHPVSDENLYDWHFTLAGPPAPSVYSNGIYHGRIILPPTYPLRPPSFRFLTPTGRFEVNREICLSISGHHEESWQPAWGIRTALLAIRSFMDGDAKGQVGGLDVGEEVRREYAGKSRGWECEVCGKSNEQVLREWRGVCRERGVEVEGEEDDGVEGEGGEGGVGSVIKQKMEKKYDTPETVAQPTPTEQPTSTEHSQPLQPVPALAPEPQQEQQVTQPSPAASLQRPEYQPQPQPAQQPVTQQSSGVAWLDRAIIGVLIALAFMILRRIANSEN